MYNTYTANYFLFIIYPTQVKARVLLEREVKCQMAKGKLSYEKPELEIIEIDEDDVIITSSGTDNDSGGWTGSDEEEFW